MLVFRGGILPAHELARISSSLSSRAVLKCMGVPFFCRFYAVMDAKLRFIKYAPAPDPQLLCL